MSHEPRKVKVGLANFYKLQLVKVDENGELIESTRRDATDWFENLITNHGMDCLGDASLGQNFARGCRVGAGNAVPTFADTNLVSILGMSATRIGGVAISRNIGVAPYYIEKTITYRFGPGVATGNIAELGLVASGSDGTGAGGVMNAATQISTRALVTPVVEKLADEVLDVVAKLRMYFDHSDVSASVLLDDDEDVTNYTYTIRPCEIDASPSTIFFGWGGGALGWDFFVAVDGSTPVMNAYVGSASGISAVTATPTGSKAVANNSAGNEGSYGVGVYTPSDYHLDYTIAFGLGITGTGINNADGIGAMGFGLRDCAYQIGFSPRINKTVDKEVGITLRVSWARFTP